MSDNNDIAEPIINSPFCEPKRHWLITQHNPPELINERRKATYYYIPPRRAKGKEQEATGAEIELPLVSEIRKRLAEWRRLALRGEGGVTRVTMELMNHWRREGRQHRLFFAQLEAAETIIFLNEARPDFLQGISVPKDEPDEEKQREGYKAFMRRCCKMATGGGKTTVMAMLAAWSILNKVANRTDGRYSAAVLVVCPNVTIRDRLAELNPQLGEASIYWTRDLVPPRFREDLRKGKVFATNWHVFEEKVFGGAGNVTRLGKPVQRLETIHIGPKPRTGHRKQRYMPEAALRHKILSGEYEKVRENHDAAGALMSMDVVWNKYIETDAALTRRALERELGGARNIMVFNDEAHHAYRLRHTASQEEDDKDDDFADAALGEGLQIKRYYKEATVWIDGLDKIHKQLGINQCVDFSATPYFLGKAGKETGRCFPWTVSNFGLHDAIEAGLVKVPQLASRDSTGATISGYFNLWEWVNRKITAGERGGKNTQAKPAALLKYASTPISMLAAEWNKLREEWEEEKKERPPVFILVCRSTELAQTVFDWLANNNPPAGVSPAKLPALQNTGEEERTVRIDSKVQDELDSGGAKSDNTRWMRFVLDTVGKTEWKRDSQGRDILPKGFAELAKKLGREKFLQYPPGRDVRCIVSVAMLTEGWDCNTVTHIVGLRPFMSQLLCEQVVGRGLRRDSYETEEREAQGKTLELMSEEIATVIGVPLTLYPLKAEKKTKKKQAPKFHIYAAPSKAKYAIQFPRVEGWRHKPTPILRCDVSKMPEMIISPKDEIPRSVHTSAGFRDSDGMVSANVPGKTRKVSLEEFRRNARIQWVVFNVAANIAKKLVEGKENAPPANALLAQVCAVVRQYIARRVKVEKGADIKDIYFSKYYQRLTTILQKGLGGEASGEKLPLYERGRACGSTADVSFYTRREPCPIAKSHLNALVPDTKKFEQSAGYALDNCPQVAAFVKNEGLGFAIAYEQDDELREYMPDFIVRLQNDVHLVLETKQAPDAYKESKVSAAKNWAAAVTADGEYGVWHYAIVDDVADIDAIIGELCPPSAA